ncbi:MAG: hypothetical protein AAFO83_11075 [Cyanobacteria bacterium J06607_13]
MILTKQTGAIAATLLILTGSALPSLAKPTTSPHTKTAPLPTTSDTHWTDTASIEADIEQIVADIITAETAHWSPTEKSALAQMRTLKLTDDELATLAALSAGEMDIQLKKNPKLTKISATGISSEQALKLAPAVLLSRYLFNIGRAAVWGGVVSAIRAADFDYGAMSTALRSGDSRAFAGLLRDGFTGQASFVNMVSTAATFACGSATLDFTPGLCDRFANGLQKIFRRVERSGRQSRRPMRNTATPSTARNTAPQNRQRREVR